MSTSSGLAIKGADRPLHADRCGLADSRERGVAQPRPDLPRDLPENGLERQLGLKVGVPKPIRARGREIYKLLYASPHEKGLEVWEHARREDPGGQIELYLAT
jgi:hypothetical protein